MGKPPAWPGEGYAFAQRRVHLTHELTIEDSSTCPWVLKQPIAGNPQDGARPAGRALPRRSLVGGGRGDRPEVATPLKTRDMNVAGRRKLCLRWRLCLQYPLRSSRLGPHFHSRRVHSLR